MAKFAQVLPERLKAAVDRLAAHDRFEPAIGIGRERIGMHHQRTRRIAGPSRDHAGAAPWRGDFEEIGVEGGDRRVQRILILEIPIFAVERKARRRDRHDPGHRAALDHLMPVTRGQDDDLMAQLGTNTHLLLDIGFYPAAMGRVKRANINDPQLALLSVTGPYSRWAACGVCGGKAQGLAVNRFTPPTGIT
jgi:hypothetical protein